MLHAVKNVFTGFSEKHTIPCVTLKLELFLIVIIIS